jgi:N-formylglutamate amidohydrolase
MERKKIILHIPHASAKIPFQEGYLVGKDILEKEMLKLTDWYTDDLFDSADDILVRADFSRVFCDAERFADDKREPMAKYGMGVLYEKLENGKPLRRINPYLRRRILNNFYWQHHQMLNEAVNEQLEMTGTALIIDCHSFPDRPLNRDLDQNPDRPDFNLGTDPFHTPEYLTDASIEYFRNKGYSVKINRPYSSTMVPLSHYHKNKNVKSVMLEVNRGLYLEEDSNKKSADYDKIKKVISGFIEKSKGEFYLFTLIIVVF